MITNYGIDNFLWIVAIGILSIIVALFFKSNLWILIPLFILGLFLTFIAIWFFRDPYREIPKEALNNSRIILSPADGTITEIVHDNEPNFLKSTSIRISIFLSPLDVHVNRVPTNGIIKYFDFIKGKKLVASKAQASSENQQTLFGLENEHGKILFKQIVGILARRLVWDIKPGDRVIAGQKFGMMKFGSRMDVHLPIDSKILVKTGDKVTAGITYLAKLESNKNED